MDMKLPSSFWKPRKVETGETLLWRIGTLSLWTCRTGRGWSVYWKREDTFFISPMLEHEAEFPPEEPGTLYLTVKEGVICMRPRLPDRPMVVRPLHPEVLIPRRNVYVYVYVPLWIAVTVGTGKKTQVLAEIPAVASSKTWFGTAAAGELCYGLEGGIHTEPNNPARGDFHAVVPLRIQNNSSQNLSFERLNLRTPNMKLFATDRFFCTNQVEVTFKGEREESQISFRSAPPEAWQAHAAGPPRIRPTQDVFTKSFWLIRNITEG